ncbi:hypothetical protein [Noviherbaspirillum cavernae]|uniref:hypothetical protein n=1 Tax=Noviherbaspirillum cavernae TaxID=2320862 RepID=UPI0011C3CE39|nr:hypothetical protein [Noviherbaspirillum cavernae]
MKSKSGLYLASLLCALMLGACQKASDPPKPAAADSGSAAAPPSVAAPPSAMPPSDAQIKPEASGAPKSGDSNNPTQASPSTLSQEQEKTAMPLPGQPNSHSVPDSTGEKKN